MNAPVFADSNVFIYWLDAIDPAKQKRASLWIEELWKSRSGRVSFQVLQECFVALTRRNPEWSDRVRAELRNLLAWQPVVIDAAVLERAWRIQDRYRLSFWDSLIVAAAAAAGCRWLLTEDLQRGQTMDGVTVVNPFLSAPDQLWIQ
jgi:predicted nucleic acid-binding protein